MASPDSLPADQRAVLQLVLARRRSYEEIARLLSIDRGAVRDRALAALDALAPQTGVAPEQRALIADYLLGQLSPGMSDQVGERLARSPSERTWARVLASELAPLATGPLPEIPLKGGGTWEPEPSPQPPAPPSSRKPEAQAGGAPPAAREHPRSRVGGAILLGLGALAAVAVVIVVLLSNGSSSNHSSSTPTAAASTSTTPAPTSTTASTSAHVVAQINLNSPDTQTKAAGIADVLKQGTVTGIAIAAQGLAPNRKRPPDAYAVWLYNSASDSHILGFVTPGIGSNGRLQTATPLPSNAAHYKQLLVTLETAANPHAPGKIVLHGLLNLG